MQADSAASPAFADFDLPAPLLQGLTELGYSQPTPVQALVLPPALAGQDVAGQAPTGSGKTAAYGLAILAQIDPKVKAVQALVIVPARELALQVREALKGLAAPPATARSEASRTTGTGASGEMRSTSPCR